MKDTTINYDTGGAREVRSAVAKLAAIYRRGGESLSEAFIRAWADVKKYGVKGVAEVFGDMADAAEDAAAAVDKVGGSVKKAAKSSELYLSGLDQIRRYGAASASPSKAEVSPGTGGGGDLSTEAPLQTERESLDIIKKITERFRALAGLLGGFWGAFRRGFRAVFGDVKSGLSWLYEHAAAIFGAFCRDWPRGFADAAAGISVNIASVLSSAFSGIVGFAGKIGTEFVARLIASLAANRERLAEGVRAVLASMGEVTGAAAEIVRYVSDRVLPEAAEAFVRAQDAMMPVGDFIAGTLSSAWRDVFAPALSRAAEGVRLFGELMRKLWEDVLVPLAGMLTSMLAPAVKVVTGVLGELWRNIILPLADAVTGTLSAAWRALCAVFTGVVIPVLSAVIGALSFMWDNVLGPLVCWLYDTFSPVMSSVFAAVGGVIDGLRGTLSGILSFIGSVFLGDWRNIWESVKSTFASIWSTLASVAKTPLNLIIGLVNKMIDGIAYGVNAVVDAANGLHWDIPGWVPIIGGQKFGFDLPMMTAAKIPYLARGAVIPPRAPFMAVLGDQRRGTNIEAPLSTIEEAVEGAVRRACAARDGSKASGEYRFIAQLNRRTLFNEFITEAKLRQATTGKNPLILE